MRMSKCLFWYWLARILDWIAWGCSGPAIAQSWAWEKWNCAANQYWIDHPEEYDALMKQLAKTWP